MNRVIASLAAVCWFLPAGWSAEAVHRSQIRIRDPFVLPDPTTRTYFIYNTTDWGSEEDQKHRAVIVYRSKDLEHWETPTPVFNAPEGHWGRQAIWAPEVHRFNGRYYLFVTLTSDESLPAPEGRPRNRKRGTEILVADRPEGPFRSFANRPHTPEDWMSLDGTLWVEDAVPYMIFCHEWIQIVMVIHQPNRRVERARFFEMEDLGDTLRIKRELANFNAAMTHLSTAVTHS